MPQTDVQSLVTLLSNGQADLSVCFPTLYLDAIDGLGNQDWLTAAVPITFTENNSSVDLPANLLNIIKLIYDDTVLSDLTLRELESINPKWRVVKGKPIAFTRETESAKVIEVFPIPVATSPPIVPVHGLPTGLDYSPGNGICIQSERRNDAPAYLNLPLALLVLQREYARESDHVDAAFAMACGQLAQLLLGII